MRHPLSLLLAPLLLASCQLGLPNTRETQQEMTDEQRIELYSSTATYLYEDNSFDRAQGQAVKVLELDPNNRPMRRMIGWIRLRMGTPEDLLIAEDFFRDLVSDGDENQTTMIGLGTTLERLGTGYEQAAKRVLAGEQRPSGGTDQERAAASLMKKSQRLWTESIEYFEGTLTEGEGSVASMNGLQRVHALQGDYVASLSWSERLIETTIEESQEVRRILTQADLTREDEVALRENERASQDLQLETHLFAATILYELGRLEDAIAHLDSVVDTFPAMADGYSRRAQLLAKTGSYSRAVEDLDRYLALSTAADEHPDVRQAFDLRSECVAALASTSKN